MKMTMKPLEKGDEPRPRRQGTQSHTPRRQSLVPMTVTGMVLLLVCLWSVLRSEELTPSYAKKNTKDTHEVNLLDASLTENQGLNLSSDNDPATIANQIWRRIGASVETRLTQLMKKAKTPECRALIGEHYGYFINAIGTERSLPFSEMELNDTCPDTKYHDFDNLPEGMHIGHIQNKTYQPPRNESDYIDHADNLRLLYGILTHDNPEATMRLVNVLYEEGHTFVVHVDGKESADETYQTLVDFASTRAHVHILPTSHRVRVNWGGFTMVNATMQILQYAFCVGSFQDYNHEPLDFHKFVHLASTSYPIASNAAIREKIASFPLEANLLHVIMKPNSPHYHAWHYFVECDDSLHRIYRLKPLSHDSGGIDMHTSSQWFIISRDFAKYLAECTGFCHEFLEYCQHVVVADETFFGTVLRNTPFCTTHHNWNFLHLQFDRWESDLEEGQRDPRKCMMPRPDHCGRSPTTMTMDYMDILELTGDLFARKFIDEVDSQIKDVLDMKRNGTYQVVKAPTDDQELSKANESLGLNQTFAGHGVLIVAKDTVHDAMPLCLGLGPAANQVRLTPCFHDWVPKTLAEDWVTGVVIQEEVAPNNRWEFNPCSSDGALRRLDNGELRMTPGHYSPTGPRCMIKQVDGLRSGRCMDGDFGNTKPGGKAHVFPCVQRWNQFFSVGNGTLAPDGSLLVTIPSHIVRNLERTGGHKQQQEAHLCLGAYGRGEEETTLDDEASNANESDGKLALMPARARYPDGSLVPLKKWKDTQLITTDCSNTDSVIEWLYVPFILEGAADDSEESNEDDGETEEEEAHDDEGDESDDETDEDEEREDEL